MFSRASVRNTQPFILGEIVTTVCLPAALSNSSCLKDSICRSGVTFSKLARSDFDTANAHNYSVTSNTIESPTCASPLIRLPLPIY